jgi:hypothetical protein
MGHDRSQSGPAGPENLVSTPRNSTLRETFPNLNNLGGEKRPEMTVCNKIKRPLLEISRSLDVSILRGGCTRPPTPQETN